MTSSSLGQLIKDLRESAGVHSQRELARRLDVDASYISRLEKDEREPSISFLRELSQEIDIPFSLLLSKLLLVSLDELDQKDRETYGKIADQLLDIAQEASKKS